MEKNINTKHFNFNMIKKLSFIMILMFISMLNVNSVPIVNYPIDEGFGGVIFDSANVGKTGIVMNKPKNVNWVQRSLHGLYSVGFRPGKGDLFQILDYPQLTPQIGNFTMEIEYMPLTPVGVTETVFDKLGSYTFSITPTAPPIQPLPPAPPIPKTPDGTLTLTIGAIPTIIPISNITYGNINTLIITFNGTAYSVYNNAILQGLPILSVLPISLSPLSPLTLFDDNLMTGLNTQCQGVMPLGSICSFSGLIDEFRIDNVYLNATQVTGILNNVNPLNPTTNTTIPIVTQLIKNVSSPVTNSTFIENLRVNINLNEIGTCNLYIDNNFKKTYNNILAINDLVSFNKNYGTHTSFLNCFNSKFNEITNPVTFNVTKTTNSQIQFIFTGTDFPITSIPLEVVSPCLNKGFTLGGIIPAYRSLANPGGATFHDVVNGQATMTLPTGTHEFCLIHGIVSYDTYNHTNKWQATNIVKQLSLGSFDLPNNLTTSYAISLDKFDIYDKTNPKAWGQTWTSLISSLIAFVLGIIILGAGATTGSGQAVMIGGLLILFSLGYQISNLVMGVLF